MRESMFTRRLLLTGAVFFGVAALILMTSRFPSTLRQRTETEDPAALARGQELRDLLADLQPATQQVATALENGTDHREAFGIIGALLHELKESLVLMLFQIPIQTRRHHAVSVVPDLLSVLELAIHESNPRDSVNTDIEAWRTLIWQAERLLETSTPVIDFSESWQLGDLETYCTRLEEWRAYNVLEGALDQ